MRYRRIEVNAFRRRVTIVSGEWPRQTIAEQPPQTDDGVSLNDTDSCEPVTPDSPEGQVILVEALRSLERRLSPENRTRIRAGHYAAARNHPNRNSLYLMLKSLYQFACLKAPRFARREK